MRAPARASGSALAWASVLLPAQDSGTVLPPACGTPRVSQRVWISGPELPPDLPGEGLPSLPEGWVEELRRVLASGSDLPPVPPGREPPFFPGRLTPELDVASGRAVASGAEMPGAWEPVGYPPATQERAASFPPRSSVRGGAGRKPRKPYPQASRGSAIVSARPRIQKVVAGSSRVVAQAPSCF